MYGPRGALHVAQADRVPIYLTDASIWRGVRKHPGSHLPGLLADRIAADGVATCVPVALEVLTGAPDGRALDADWQAVWAHLRWLPVGDGEMSRALELLRELAHTTEGAHRRRPIDYVIAACAEAAGEQVVLWHWDRDLTVICDHVGIAHEAEHDRARAAGIDLPGQRG